jgi:flagellar hook-basal body complex protein FliE
MKNPSSSKGTTLSKNLNKKLQKISKVQKNAKKKIFFFLTGTASG